MQTNVDSITIDESTSYRLLDIRGVSPPEQLCYIMGGLCHSALALCELTHVNTTPGRWKDFQGPLYFSVFPNNSYIWYLLVPIFKRASIWTAPADCTTIINICQLNDMTDWIDDVLFGYLLIIMHQENSTRSTEVLFGIPIDRVQYVTSELVDRIVNQSILTPLHAEIMITFLYTGNIHLLIRSLLIANSEKQAFNVVQALLSNTVLEYNNVSHSIKYSILHDLIMSHPGFLIPFSHPLLTDPYVQLMVNRGRIYEGLLNNVKVPAPRYTKFITVATFCRIVNLVGQDWNSLLTFFLCNGDGLGCFLVYDRLCKECRPQVTIIKGTICNIGRMLSFMQLQFETTEGIFSDILPPKSILDVEVCLAGVMVKLPLDIFVDFDYLINQICFKLTQLADRKGYYAENAYLNQKWITTTKGKNAWTVLSTINKNKDVSLIRTTSISGEITDVSITKQLLLSDRFCVYNVLYTNNVNVDDFMWLEVDNYQSTQNVFPKIKENEFCLTSSHCSENDVEIP